MAFIPGTNFFAKLNANVNIYATNEFGYAILADCIGNPNIIALQSGIYWTGCFMIRNDILTGSNVYQNQGTFISPNWVLIGSGGASGYQYNEIPTPAADGTTTAFTLAHVPTAPSVMLVVLNGSIQTPLGVSPDYSITGAIITFISAPVAGSTLVVYYS